MQWLDPLPLLKITSILNYPIIKINKGVHLSFMCEIAFQKLHDDIEKIIMSPVNQSSSPIKPTTPLSPSAPSSPLFIQLTPTPRQLTWYTWIFLKPLTRSTMVLFYISLETLGSLAIWVYGSISSYLIGPNLSHCLVELARTVQFWVVCRKVLSLTHGYLLSWYLT